MNKGRMEILAKLLDKVADSESEPLLGFNMHAFTSRVLRDKSVHACGTAACIAGWTIAAFGSPAARAAVLSGDVNALRKAIGFRPAEHAMSLLDLESPALFFTDLHMGPREAAAKIRRMARDEP